MRKNGIFYLCISAFILGVGIYTANIKPQNNYAQFIYQRVYFTAQIIAEPKEQQFNYDLVVLPYAQKQSLLLKTGKQAFEYGDKLFVFGYPREIQNKTDFDHVNYLHTQNIYAVMNSTQVFIINKSKGNYLVYYSLRFKQFLINKIFGQTPKDVAGILIAFVFGEKQYLNNDTENLFARTGTIHLIAVSGYKLTLIVIALEKLKKYIGKYSLIISSIFIFFYLISTSFAPAVLRAAIMSFIFVACSYTGRRYNQLAILFAIAAIFMIQNTFVIYDIGFLLSFVGLLGIILLVPLYKKLFKIFPETYFKEIFIASLAAQTATLPLTIYYFQQFTFFAAFNNALLLPLLAPTIICAYCICLPQVGLYASKICALVVKLIYSALLTLDKLPWYFEPKITQSQMLWTYFIGIIGYIYLHNRNIFTKKQ